MGWSEPKKFGTQIYDLGTSTSTWDIPALIEGGTLPSNIDFTQLTTENFVCGMVSVGVVQTAGSYTSDISYKPYAHAVGVSSFDYSYDASTGVFSVLNNKQTIQLRQTSSSSTILKTATQTFTCQAWLVC